MLGYVMEQLIDEVPPYPGKKISNCKSNFINGWLEFFCTDAPQEVPKYKFPDARIAPGGGEPSKDSPGLPQDPDMDTLRVNLFSGWGEDATKSDDEALAKADRARDRIVVNYSTSDMSSEVEMLDSSTAHIEYK